MGSINNDLISIERQKLVEVIVNAIDQIGNSKNGKVKPKMMTISEVCQYTTYKRPSIYQFVHNKSIPYVKNKGRLFFEKEAIDDWLHGKNQL